MSTFRLYLWKEWREQRTAVLALAGMLPLLVLAITIGMHRRQVGLPYFSGVIGLGALAVTLLAIGGELLGSDRRAGGQWLERLPAGLPGAFPAKLALFALTSVLALTYGFVVAQLGVLMRGRPADSPLDLVQCDTFLALSMLGAAAVLASWTFAASAWTGRGMLALLGGGLVLAGIALGVRHFVQMEYTPPALEIVLVAFGLVAAGLTSAWVGFVRGRRFGRGLLATAARGLPAGALCVLPVAGWSLHQLRDRGAFDFPSPESRVCDAWVSGNGRVALLYVQREDERWDTLPSRVVRVDLEQGTYETIGRPGAAWTQVAEDLGKEPMQEPDEVWIRGEDLTVESVLDAFTGEVHSGEGGGSLDSSRSFRTAGHGFTIYEGDSYVRELVDPYHGLHVQPDEVGLGSWMGFHIGPTSWLVNAWMHWLEYTPDCAELVTAHWMGPSPTPGPMLADGRLLVHISYEGRFALADPKADVLVPLSGPGSNEYLPVYLFLQEGGLHPGEPAFVETSEGRHRLDEERLELVPCDDSYGGELLRWLPDGTLFFLTDDGLYRRAPSGERTCVFSFAKAEVTP